MSSRVVVAERTIEAMLAASKQVFLFFHFRPIGVPGPVA